jgi:hypothetical protein
MAKGEEYKLSGEEEAKKYKSGEKLRSFAKRKEKENSNADVIIKM